MNLENLDKEIRTSANHLSGVFETFTQKFDEKQALKPQIYTLDPDEPIHGLYPATYWFYEEPYFNYRHTTGEDFYNYMLPAVEDNDLGEYANEIILTTTFTTAMPTAELFAEEAGEPVIWDKEITIEAGDTWTFLIKNLGATWHIYPMKEKMQ